MSQNTGERLAAPPRLLALLLLLVAAAAAADAPMLPPAGGDIPEHFSAATAQDDYIKREAMIPMRDGVSLYTVIVVPKGAHDAPILLTRTPYNATVRARRSWSTRMLDTLPQGDEEFAGAGYMQSSWFPLYDRNPQTYVPNVFFARPSDYVKATQRIYRSAASASAVWLPIVP